MSKISSTIVGAAGEYHVLSQLLRRGWIAALAPASPLAQISSIIHRDPHLSPEGSVALEELIRATYSRLRTDGDTPTDRPESRNHRADRLSGTLQRFAPCSSVTVRNQPCSVYDRSRASFRRLLPGSLIVTDDWSGYGSLRTRGYDHRSRHGGCH